MTEAQRALLDIVSQSLDYPDEDFFAALPALVEKAKEALEPAPCSLVEEFANQVRQEGASRAQQKYVAVFDHDPATSLYLAWHRYGNDRGQGRALAALNGLYRAGGFEPIYGSMPDYLPRILEFMALADEWAIETILDGFGPEMYLLAQNLLQTDPVRGKLLMLVFEQLKTQWPHLFKPRNGVDATRRPMARPEPEKPLRPMEILSRANTGQEDNI